MEDKNSAVLQAEFDGLKELINVKLDNVCGAIVKLEATLNCHNGRLTTMEKFIEQSKGASKTIIIIWSSIVAVVASIITFIIGKSIK